MFLSEAKWWERTAQPQAGEDQESNKKQKQKKLRDRRLHQGREEKRRSKASRVQTSKPSKTSVQESQAKTIQPEGRKAGLLLTEVIADEKQVGPGGGVTGKEMENSLQADRLWHPGVIFNKHINKV